MTCRVCSSEAQQVFRGRVLNKYDVGYFLCPQCDFLQTEEPYWLEESYTNSMNLTDTGVMHRNIVLSRSAATLLFFAFDRNAKFIDYAGGFGIFTRIMRDIGFDFYTTDPHTPNLVARGFDTIPDHAEVLTTFECFEHFVNPMQELEKLLSLSKNIFFSTHPHPSPVPPLNKWWYYDPHHGQHIAFYSSKTFRYMAKQFDLNYYSLLNYHLLTPKTFFWPWYAFLIAAGRFGLYLGVKLLMKSRRLSDQEVLRHLPQSIQ